MTAEIAVMNRVAIALAADSASTSLFAGNVPKIYNTADKLFALDEREPIGAMIYGSASFMRVPWETLIKLFRSTNSGSRDTVADYGRAFLDFLITEPLLTDDFIDDYFRSTVNWMADQFMDAATKESSEKNIDLTDAIKGLLQSLYQNWNARSFLGDMNDGTIQELRARYQAFLEKFIEFQFPDLPSIGSTERDQLKELSLLFMVKDLQHASSGIVVAGFGTNELFPTLVSYDIEGMVYPRHLRYRAGYDTAGTSIETGANIIPFAQAEMVHSFMTGIDPDLRVRIGQIFEELIKRLTERMVSRLPQNLSQDETSSFSNEILQTAKLLNDEFAQELGTHSRERYVDPVLDAVELLPKDQLAVMAETLVALTSFKRRMSRDSETVGGAIDVAVISKGDGFVWIKRKHYFDPALNPRYMERVRTRYQKRISQ